MSESVHASRGEEAPVAGATRFGLRSVVGLTALVAGAGPFLLLLLLVQRSWAPLESLDGEVASRLNAVVSGDRAVISVLEAVTDLGGNGTAVLVLALTAAFLLIRRQRRLGVFVITTGAGLAVLVPVTKALIGRARPMVDSPVVATPENASFPSGHAMASLVTWGVLLLLVLPAARRALRPWLVAGTVVVVVAVGFTRVALGVHFVSDVLAGWALAIAWLAVTTAAFRAWQHEQGLRTASRGDVLEEEGDPDLTAAPSQQALLADGRTTVTRLVGVAVALAVALTGLGLVVTGPLSETALGRLDGEAARWFVQIRTPFRTQVAETVGGLSGTPLVIGASLTIAVLVLAVTASWRPVLFVAVTVLGEVGLYFLVSQVVARARPDVVDLTVGLPVRASWPSGHVAAAAALYGALAILVLGCGRGRGRWAVLAVPVLVVPAVAVSRMYVAAHYPTDVVAGMLLGTAWVAACAYLLQPCAAPRPRAGAAPAGEPGEDLHAGGLEGVGYRASAVDRTGRRAHRSTPRSAPHHLGRGGR